jgi:hypothetical protein
MYSTDGKGYDLQLYILRSIGTLFASTFTMYAMFGPKVYNLYKDADDDFRSTGIEGSVRKFEYLILFSRELV